MNIALDKISNQLVDLNSAIQKSRRYICPKCLTSVVFSPGHGGKTPHFKHLKGQADKNCELYCNTLYQKVTHSPIDSGHSLFLKQEAGTIQLYIYIPEFDKDSVSFIGQDVFQRMNFDIEGQKVSTLKAWPGSNGIAIKLALSPSDISVIIENKFDIQFDFSKWEKKTRGINPAGTFFEHPDNGGQRLSKNILLRRDRKLILTGISNRIKIPDELWPDSVDFKIIYEQNNWIFYEISFTKIDNEIQNWIRSFSYNIEIVKFNSKLIWPTPMAVVNNEIFKIAENQVVFEICPDIKIDEIIVEVIEKPSNSYREMLKKQILVQHSLVPFKFYYFKIDQLENGKSYIVSIGEKVLNEIVVWTPFIAHQEFETDHVVVTLIEKNITKTYNPLAGSQVQIDPSNFISIDVTGPMNYEAFFDYGYMADIHREKIPFTLNEIKKLPIKIDFNAYGKICFTRDNLKTRQTSNMKGIETLIDKAIMSTKKIQKQRNNNHNILVIRQIASQIYKLKRLKILPKEIDKKVSILISRRFYLSDDQLSMLKTVLYELNSVSLNNNHHF